MTVRPHKIVETTHGVAQPSEEKGGNGVQEIVKKKMRTRHVYRGVCRQMRGGTAQAAKGGEPRTSRKPSLRVSSSVRLVARMALQARGVGEWGTREGGSSAW